MSKRRQIPVRAEHDDEHPPCPEGCGKCCDPVVLVYSQADVASMGLMMSDRDRNWVLNELTPISRREGLRRTPHFKGGGKTVFQFDGAGSPTVAFSLFYECKNLDPVTKMCRVYDDRPSACRDFPIDTDAPTEFIGATALPDGCVYEPIVARYR